METDSFNEIFKKSMCFIVLKAHYKFRQTQVELNGAYMKLFQNKYSTNIAMYFPPDH